MTTPSTEKQELHRRIALSNRPRLDVTQKRLDEVSAALAENSDHRARFVNDPTAYLQSQSLPVSSCAFAKTNDNVAQTSEVCSVFVYCGTYVNVDVRQMSCMYIALDCAPLSRIWALVIGVELMEDVPMALNSGWTQNSQLL
ncbi:MAG TPA: hypothetical protein VJT82_01425 [Pyrinomonadaceae bacterium]|nr:hypothetical protein [Pyrinomonadaceae bacterium]